ncbi:MAG: hypothetical protein ACI9ES_001237 [Oceanospirillaceae bacterium]|jgi:hypothetical protein
MRMINCIKQIKEETLPMRLVSFADSTAGVMPNHDVETSGCILYETQRRHIYEVKHTSNTTLAHHAEIEKLNNKITRLQDEKSVLVKWVEFLF